MATPTASPFAPVPINFGTPAPTTPATVPTAAPTGQTSTKAPAATPTPAPATPVAVNSSKPAATQVSNIQGTLTQAQMDLQNQQSIQAAAKANADALAAKNATPTGGMLPGSNVANQGKPGYDVFGNPVQSPSDGAALPDSSHQFIYDAKTGAQTNWPIGQAIPPGFSTTNPTVPPNAGVVASVTTSAGTSYQKFADGTYGAFDINGKYIGTAQQQDFDNAQGVSDTMKQMTQLQNGTYPLTANQQAQITGLQNQYAQLIEQQKVANANLTGGTTVAMNLYGMGNSVTGLGEIKGSIDSGLAKIADLNSKLASAVASMEAGFQTDDLNMINSAYKMYSDAVTARQTNIDNIQKAITDAKDKADALAMQQKQMDVTANNATDSSIRSVIDEAGKGGASSDQIAAMNKALANHDFAGAVQAAAGSLQDPTSPAGQYSAYVKTQQASGKAPMSAGDFLAAQKYKDAYAAASADAQARAAFTSSDAVQNKLESQLQKTIQTSRSDLGIQEKKVSNAIDLRRLFNQYKNPDGTYKLPPTGYTEMAVGLATLLSPTGIPAQSTIKDLQQSTAVGDWGKVYTYMTGQQASGSSQDIFKNLSDSIDGLGSLSESLRNQYLQAETPTDLESSRVDHVLGGLPSYNKMSNGDIAYQSPEQIATTAKTNVQSLVTSDPSKAAMVKDMLAVPGSTYTTIAQKLGLLPSAQ